MTPSSVVVVCTFADSYYVSVGILKATKCSEQINQQNVLLFYVGGGICKFSICELSSNHHIYRCCDITSTAGHAESLFVVACRLPAVVHFLTFWTFYVAVFTTVIDLFI